ncbi:hypothetical protein Hanom_Chr03g00239261 [Helianthus anomalus]
MTCLRICCQTRSVQIAVAQSCSKKARSKITQSRAQAEVFSKLARTGLKFIQAQFELKVSVMVDDFEPSLMSRP